MQMNNESMLMLIIYTKNEVYYISLLDKSDQTVNSDESSHLGVFQLQS